MNWTLSGRDREKIKHSKCLKALEMGQGSVPTLPSLRCEGAPGVLLARCPLCLTPRGTLGSPLSCLRRLDQGHHCHPPMAHLVGPVPLGGPCGAPWLARVLVRRTRVPAGLPLASNQGPADGKSLGTGPECWNEAGTQHWGISQGRLVVGPEGTPPRFGIHGPGCSQCWEHQLTPPRARKTRKRPEVWRKGSEPKYSALIDCLGGGHRNEPCPWFSPMGWTGRPILQTKH